MDDRYNEDSGEKFCIHDDVEDKSYFRGTVAQLLNEQAAEIEQLKALLNVSVCQSHDEVSAPTGVCEWCDAVREVFKPEVVSYE
jgi:hypothetical protein